MQMPVETRRFSAPIARSGQPSVTPLTIAALLAVVLHLVSGAMLERSHASPADDALASAAPDDEAKCASEEKSSERPLPYD
jgi:hypothetical protein